MAVGGCISNEDACCGARQDLSAPNQKEEALHYIGIDIAKDEHVVGILDGNGSPRGAHRSFANDAQGFRSLLDRFSELGIEADDSIVAMEATGHYWMATYVFLVDHGFEVAVVNPSLIDAFRKSDTLRKTKTDAVDAFLIAKFAWEKRICASAMSPEESDGLKQLTRYRQHLVKERTMLKNRCTAVIDRVFPEFESLFDDAYGGAAKSLLKHDPTPAGIASTDIRTLTKLVKEGSRGRLGRAKAEAVKAAAKESVGVPFATSALAFEISHIVSLIDHLDDQVKELDAEISRILAETPGRWLVTIPGIGETLAAAIVSEIGDPERFDDPKKVIAYAGIDSTKVESGKFVGKENRMSKKGSPHLRHTLMLAANSVRKRDPYFGDYYDAKIAEGKHHYVALSGVARKLAGVCLTLMKEQRAYEPRPSIQSAK